MLAELLGECLLKAHLRNLVIQNEGKHPLKTPRNITSRFKPVITKLPAMRDRSAAAVCRHLGVLVE
jgi:hypothetical protein